MASSPVDGGKALVRDAVRIQQVAATPSEVKVSLKVVFMSHGKRAEVSEASGPTSVRATAVAVAN